MSSRSCNRAVDYDSASAGRGAQYTVKPAPRLQERLSMASVQKLQEFKKESSERKRRASKTFSRKFSSKYDSEFWTDPNTSITTA